MSKEAFKKINESFIETIHIVIAFLKTLPPTESGPFYIFEDQEKKAQPQNTLTKPLP